MSARFAMIAMVLGLEMSFLAGCSKWGWHFGSAGSSHEAMPEVTEKQKSVLRAQMSSEPTSLDPAEIKGENALLLVRQMREGLVGFDENGRLQPLLAESWKISPDQKRYEFTLKPKLLWSDGQPVKIHDFVFGIRRALSPKIANPTEDPLMAIRGAKDYRSGKLKPPVGFMVHPKDKTIGVFEENGKLVFELESPDPHFLQALTLPAALPVRQDMLIESSGKWTEDKAPGTGPYRFAAYQPGKRLLIEANPHYRNGPPQVGLIDVLFIPNEAEALKLFEAGQLDLLIHVPQADEAELRQKGFQGEKGDFISSRFQGFKVSPMGDVNFGNLTWNDGPAPTEKTK